MPTCFPYQLLIYITLEMVPAVPTAHHYKKTQYHTLSTYNTINRILSTIITPSEEFGPTRSQAAPYARSP